MSCNFYGPVNDIIILYNKQFLQLLIKIKLCVWSKSKKQQKLDIGIDFIKKLISEYNLKEPKCFSNLSLSTTKLFQEVISSLYSHVYYNL